MLNPMLPTQSLAAGTLAICDSGAFQEVGKTPRLEPWGALQRQLRYEERLRWAAGDLDWHFEWVCIYDEMAGVDEAVVDGHKRKVRGTEETAARAVAETLRSARYYDRQRDRIQGDLMFVGQGISPDQYIGECLEPMLDLMRPGDAFAFGGFCIIGMRPQLKPLFYETVERALPLLLSKGIRRLHLLGVCVPDCVAWASVVAQHEGMIVSNDGSSIEVNSTYGKVFLEEGRWRKTYKKGMGPHVCDLAQANIQTYTAWAAGQSPVLC